MSPTVVIRSLTRHVALFVFVVPAVLASCTIYLRDAVDGNPWERGYDPVYAEARASGLPHEEAHRRALLHGGDSHNTVWDRRKAEEKERKEWERHFGDDDDDNFEVRWD